MRIRPPSPRSETTVCAVTMGNIVELSATTVVTLFIDFLSLRMPGYNGEAVRRRECQSIPIDVQAVFRSRTWEPTVPATSNWPIPCARSAPSSAPSSVDLDAAADRAISSGSGDARKTMNGLIAANDFLGLRFDELRAAVSKGYGWSSLSPTTRCAPHQFGTRNDLNKPQQTRSKANENTTKSMKLTDLLPLILVWLQVRDLQGPPRKLVT